jgi:hypothetical protein
VQGNTAEEKLWTRESGKQRINDTAMMQMK